MTKLLAECYMHKRSNNILYVTIKNIVFVTDNDVLVVRQFLKYSFKTAYLDLVKVYNAIEKS